MDTIETEVERGEVVAPVDGRPPDPASPPADLPAGAGRPTARQRVAFWSFVVTSFLGSGLLFLVQPMVAKMLLPLLGGSPAVWNTAMVFFQAALLAGYAYAHLSITRLGLRRQWPVQLVLLALPVLVLPIAVPAGWTPPASASPAPWTLLVLVVMVGAPFFVLATTSPTLQRWFAATDHPMARDPYFLYAAGNAGSFLALLGYPLLLEPRLSLDGQSRLWTGVYVAFVAASVVCALVMRSSRAYGDVAAPGVEERRDRPAWRTRLWWCYLAFVPSALMLGVTLHVSTDIASVPLLWVIPLSLYLVTFIIAFGARGAAATRVASRSLKLLIIPMALTFVGEIANLWVAVALPLVTFFAAAMLAHGRLAADRPEPQHLTEFYLWLSIGGVLGGLFSGLLAPAVFPVVAEFPIALALAVSLLLPAGSAALASSAAGRLVDRVRTPRTLALGAVFLVLLVASVVVRRDGSLSGLRLSLVLMGLAGFGAFFAARTPRAFAGAIGAMLAVAILVPSYETLHAERTFFGVHRVYEDADGRNVLLHGTTVHGMEGRDEAPGEPLTYFHRGAPVGQVFEQLDDEGSGERDVAVIGLGSGALAAYGRAGDRFTFYEIDPAVVDIAADEDYFSFVGQGRADVEFEVGDGRLRLAEADTDHDVIIIDAFSSDAIPVHLLTKEALELYVDRLADDGVLLMHVTNRYFELEPVIGRLAAELGLAGAFQHGGVTFEEFEDGKLPSDWVALSPDPERIEPFLEGDWQPLDDGVGTDLWTDSFSNLIGVFRWS